MKDKFNEETALNMLRNHIIGSYQEHYSMENIQSTEFIFDAGHGEGFCLGNIIKYAQRYGKKNGKDTNDLLKILHYAVMLLGKEIENQETRESNQSEYSESN